jgi:hypothetical protein
MGEWRNRSVQYGAAFVGVHSTYAGSPHVGSSGCSVLAVQATRLSRLVSNRRSPRANATASAALPNVRPSIPERRASSSRAVSRCCSAWRAAIRASSGATSSIGGMTRLAKLTDLAARGAASAGGTCWSCDGFGFGSLSIEGEFNGWEILVKRTRPKAA